MAAATKDRDSRVKASARRRRTFPVAASTTIYKGTMVALDTAGRATPYTAALGVAPVGIATEKANNSSGAAGAINVEVETGVHLMVNDGTATVVDPTHLGQPAYGQDDQTVGILATDMGAPVGVIEEVTADGVYVYFDGEEIDDDSVETVTDGAISLLTRRTLISVDGTKAYTLADGRYVGQLKELTCTVATSTPAGTLTPVSLEGSFTTLLFDAVGEGVVLRWTGAAWAPVGPITATMA